MGKSWLSVPQLARIVGCDVRTIRKMILSDTLKAERHGRCWRITVTEAMRVFPQSMAEYRAAS